MIFIKKKVNMKGRMSLYSHLLGGVVLPPTFSCADAPPYPVEPALPTLMAARNEEPDVDGCSVSDFSHNTASVRTAYQPSIAELSEQFGGAPGARWSVQMSRWTAEYYGADIHEYYTEPGEAVFYVDDHVVPFTGSVETFENNLGSLVTAISKVPGWTGHIMYNYETNESILVVTYRGGVMKKGLRIAYPNDRQGDDCPHPAVELLFNGNWNHGAPKNGGCVPLTNGDYTPKLITFPGQWAVDASTFRGSTGEASSTASTLGPNPNLTGPTYPALISEGTYTESTPLSDLGFNDGENNYFYLNMYDGDGYTGGASLFYQEGFTVKNLVDSINSNSFYGFNAFLDEQGHIVVLNMNSGVAPGLGSFVLDPQNPDYGSMVTEVFGANPGTAEFRQYTFLSSSNLFELTTPLAQFGALEYGFEKDYEYDRVSLGSPATMGDLINAINAIEGGAVALAYLEQGRLVIAVKDSSNEPDKILLARPIGSTDDAAWRQPGELLFGASTIVLGQIPYRYDDNAVTIDGMGARTTKTFGGTTIPATEAPVYTPLPTTTSDRHLYMSTPLSSLYPVGTMLMHTVAYGYEGSVVEDSFNACIEVSPYNTIRDLFNHLGQSIVFNSSTLRFVGPDGEHTECGFLRLTAPTGIKLRWYNPATKVAGDATRLFHDDGTDGQQVGGGSSIVPPVVCNGSEPTTPTNPPYLAVYGDREIASTDLVAYHTGQPVTGIVLRRYPDHANPSVYTDNTFSLAGNKTLGDFFAWIPTVTNGEADFQIGDAVKGYDALIAEWGPNPIGGDLFYADEAPNYVSRVATMFNGTRVSYGGETGTGGGTDPDTGGGTNPGGGTTTDDITPYTYRVGLKTGVSRSEALSAYVPSNVSTMIVRTSNSATDQAGTPANPDNFLYWQFPIAGKTVGDFFDWISSGGTGGRVGGRAHLLQKPDGSVYAVINGKNPDGTSTSDNSGVAATGSGGNIMWLEDGKYGDGSSAQLSDIGAYEKGIPVVWNMGRPTFTDDRFDQMFGPIDPTQVNYIFP